ncbi:hypothetical protein [Leptothoe sp. PORK10 BA2]|uniref:hypothetical protein n=1 Tax=Leptothoe sp. PORK10 BA2 TaxID=3110254 RepID=UPI002B1F52A6|nr:hypothetical protein [Leptothoe sp. PORK10 BA2]MEA5467036.1 hypothetical protein [Leptothoe sp. PORK10 BA2]
MELTRTRFLIDADLFIESILNRQHTCNNLSSIWKLIQSERIEAYVTEIGFDRLNGITRALSKSEETADFLTSLFERTIKIIYLSHRVMQQARGIDIEDYESAVETLVVNNSDLDLSGIITHLPEIFRQKFDSSIHIMTPFQIEEFFENGQEIKSKNHDEVIKIPSFADTKYESETQNYHEENENGFIGRELGVFTIKNALEKDRRQVIAIKGDIGIGKNRIALEVARLCSKTCNLNRSSNLSTFDMVIHVDSPYIYENFDWSYLGYLSRTISQATNEISINFSTPQKQLECIYRSLSSQNTLIILSNLDTAFISKNELDLFCKGLPKNVKIIITSCEEDFDFYSVTLSSMAKDDAIDLAVDIIDSNHLVIEKDEIDNIVESCSYNPLLIEATLLIAENYPDYGNWKTLTRKTPTQIQRVLIQNLFESISLPLSREILKLLSFANRSFQKEILVDYAQENSISSKRVYASLAQLCRLNLVSEEKGRYTINSIIRKLITPVIAKEFGYANRIYAKLAKIYIKFTAKYGGVDWGDWYTNYDLIDSEWENIQIILYWCKYNQRYEELKTIWDNVNHFADLYGYWKDRLIWLDELSDIFKDKDQSTYIQALSRKTWTLLMTRDEVSAIEAKRIITEAWSAKDIMPLVEQVGIAHHLFLSQTYSKQYEEAETVLKNMQKIVDDLAISKAGDKRVIQRCQINLIRDKAKLHSEKQNLKAAKRFYKKALKMSKDIYWNRAICYIYNKLADIAIQENDLKTASEFLNLGLPIAQQNRNKRRLAGYQKSFSQLEAERGNVSATRQWAKMAANLYSELGMPSQHPTLKKLIENTRM